jgi:hypothetical protein
VWTMPGDSFASTRKRDYRCPSNCRAATVEVVKARRLDEWVQGPQWRIALVAAVFLAIAIPLVTHLPEVLQWLADQAEQMEG